MKNPSNETCSAEYDSKIWTQFGHKLYQLDTKLCVETCNKGLIARYQKNSLKLFQSQVFLFLQLKFLLNGAALAWPMGLAGWLVERCEASAKASSYALIVHTLFNERDYVLVRPLECLCH